MYTCFSAQNQLNALNGNTLSGGGRANTWDTQNRLTQSVYNGVTSEFTYGADGLRRSMTVGGNTTHFLLNGQSVVQEGHLDGSNNFVADVTYLTGLRGPECRIEKTGPDTESTRWYLYDGLGSVVGELAAVYDAQGSFLGMEVTATRKFDVYGLHRGGTGTSTTDHGFVGSLGHTSEPETGLIYMRARYYDPALGRFISEDPAGDGNNWFVYCGNNPVNGVDVSGREKIWISKDFWIRWDAGKSHVHWGRGNVELGAAVREGGISHKFRFKEFPSHREMKALRRAGIKNRAASLAYDTITASFQQNPFFVIGLLFDLAGDFDSANDFYEAGGVL